MCADGIDVVNSQNWTRNYQIAPQCNEFRSYFVRGKIYPYDPKKVRNTESRSSANPIFASGGIGGKRLMAESTATLLSSQQNQRATPLLFSHRQNRSVQPSIDTRSSQYKDREHPLDEKKKKGHSPLPATLIESLSNLVNLGVFCTDHKNQYGFLFRSECIAEQW